MKKQLIQVFALCLIFCLLVSAVPVWAAEAESAQSAAKTQMSQMASSPASSSQITTQEEIVPPDASAEVTVVREEESLRGEFEKHFLMSDGSYQAVVYSYPVHELVDGVWVEIETASQNARSDVSPDSAQQNIIDNYVWQNHGVQDNNSVRLYIGNKSGYECRAFIRFATMPTIPAGATITAATMTVNIVSGTSTANLVNAYQVDDPWESSTIQWSNMPSIGTPQEFSISHNNKTKYQFSCLEAVREWYTDSTTGQNQNYGIMLRYSDNTIADYNSVYSADCTDATMRPSMVIGYTPPNSEINVLEGYTKQLPLPDAIETITWTSSDENVATVNSNGIVTGIKAGKVTITASAGGNELHTYTVYVKIEDGLYRIGLLGTEWYMGTDETIEDHAEIRILKYSDESIPEIRQLWIVKYLSGGYYSIRPLYQRDMTLHLEDNNVQIMTTGTTDTIAGLFESNCWALEFSADGYLIRAAGSSDQTLQVVSAYPRATVFAGSYSSSNPNSNWCFTREAYGNGNVLLIDTVSGKSVENKVRYIKPEQTATLSDLEIIAATACNCAADGLIKWYTMNPAVVSVDEYTGAVTGLTPGSIATVYAKHVHNGVGYTTSYTVQVQKRDGPLFIINHYYDEGYAIREGNAEEVLEQYQNYVAARFDSIFNLELYYTIEPFVSICDECKIDQFGEVKYENLDSPCDQDTYCTTTEALRSALNSQLGLRKEKASTVLWTGHRMNDNLNDRSNYSPSSKSIVITRFYTSPWNEITGQYEEASSEEKFKKSTHTLLHELSHQLGAPDHYCYDLGSLDSCDNKSCDMCVYGYDEPRDCAMSEPHDLSTLPDEDVYCADCKAIILAHIEDHH